MVTWLSLFCEKQIYFHFISKGLSHVQYAPRIICIPKAIHVSNYVEVENSYSRHPGRCPPSALTRQVYAFTGLWHRISRSCVSSFASSCRMVAWIYQKGEKLIRIRLRIAVASLDIERGGRASFLTHFLLWPSMAVASSLRSVMRAQCAQRQTMTLPKNAWLKCVHKLLTAIAILQCLTSAKWKAR